MHGERSHSALKSLCFQTEGGLHKVCGAGFGLAVLVV